MFFELEGVVTVVVATAVVIVPPISLDIDVVVVALVVVVVVSVGPMSDVAADNSDDRGEGRTGNVDEFVFTSILMLMR